MQLNINVSIYIVFNLGFISIFTVNPCLRANTTSPNDADLWNISRNGQRQTNNSVFGHVILPTTCNIC